MKKLLILLTLFSITGCFGKKQDSTSEGFNGAKLDIYSVNDLHGAINTSNTNNLAITGNYLINQKNNNPYSLILANGDMFQGTAISNYFYGLPIIEWMNYVGFDSMTFGNHEFDWGIEEIIKYKDGNLENGEANFNFLGANIFSKSSNEKVEWAGTYDIFNLENLKVGVIGVIGKLETSIAAARIAPYKFIEVADTVAKYAEILRKDEKVDIVIANIHDYEVNDINEIAYFTGNKKVDAIITGHRHIYVEDVINGIPIVQAGSSNNAIGKITLNLNSNKKVTSTTVKNISLNSISSSSNQYIKSNIIDYYQELTNPIFEEPLVVAGEYADKTVVGVWAADLMKKYTNSDLALVNTGGIRSGFPVLANEEVNFARIIAFAPFDNYVKWGEYSGEKLLKLLNFLSDNCSGYFFSLNDTCSSINTQVIDTDKTYKVATVDYVFDYFEEFYGSSNQGDTAVLLSTLMKEDVKLSATLKDLKWYPTKGAVIDNSIDFSTESAMINSFIFNNYMKKEEIIYE